MLGRPACLAGTAETRSGSRREERRGEGKGWEGELVITSVMEGLTSRLAIFYLQIVCFFKMRKNGFKMQT